VAIVAGSDAIADYSDSIQIALLLLVAVALILAVVAVVLTALAAQGIPKKFRPVTGRRLAAWTIQEASKAAGRLAAGRVLGIAAGVLVALAGVIAMSATTFAPGGGINTLIKTDSGQIECGQLERDDEGSLVLSYGEDSTFELSEGIDNAAVVDACP
jgi:high-affinity K+ transport system ATPase subunit B